MLPNQQPSGRPTPHESSAVLNCARRLQDSLLETGGLQLLLKGKRIALLSGAGAAYAAQLTEAAETLGARVARVNFAPSDQPEASGALARMLGKLYDAIACDGLADALVDQLARESGIPVLASNPQLDRSPAALAEQLDPRSSADQRLRLVLQALLVYRIC